MLSLQYIRGHRNDGAGPVELGIGLLHYFMIGDMYSHGTYAVSSLVAESSKTRTYLELCRPM